MRTPVPSLVLIGGLLTAGAVWAQERTAPERAEPRVMQPSNREVMRAQREEMQRGAPASNFQPRTESFQPRNDRLQESLGPRNRLLNGRDINSNQLRPAPVDPRDPRMSDYQTRAEPQDFRRGYVPQDMQRAIERAQAEHGGKVLSADRIRYRGQDTYRVKLLTPGGRVRVVQLSEAPAAANETDNQRKGDE